MHCNGAGTGAKATINTDAARRIVTRMNDSRQAVGTPWTTIYGQLLILATMTALRDMGFPAV